MGFLSHLFWPWGVILQGLALVHFIRRRPDGFWLYVILFLGPMGAVVYLLAEAAPDARLLRGTFQVFPRRKKIRELEAAIQHNPSPGNFEDLGDLYLEDGRVASARGAYDRSIGARADTLGPFYGRGACALRMGDAAAALPDLERVVSAEYGYDFYRAAGLLAHAYANTGQQERAEAIFRHVTAISTLSETYLNFAQLLLAEGKVAEARAWAQRVLDKKVGMPRYLQRRERPNFRAARALLKRIGS
jgi:hypothetical protein